MKTGFLLCAALWTGCVFAAAESRIIDGVEVDPAQYPTVAKIISPTGSTDANGNPTFQLGTGTLITSRHVLTCAHVVHGMASPTIVTVDGIDYVAAFITEHPTYNPALPAVSEGMSDLAIITLSEEVAGVVPCPIISTAPFAGQAVEILGYGDTRNGGNMDHNLYRGATQYEAVNSTNTGYFFDAGEQATAPGDSGGPAFVVFSDGTRCLSTLHQAAPIGAADAFMGVRANARIDNQIPWIESVCGSVAKQPAPQPPAATPQPPPTPVIVLHHDYARASFTVNLARPLSDKFTFTMTPNTYIELPTSYPAVVYIGTKRIDAMTVSGKSGIGSSGKLTVNPRTGQIKYTCRRVDLKDALSAQGVTIGASSETITLFVGLNGTYIGGTYGFALRSKEGKFVRGKY